MTREEAMLKLLALEPARMDDLVRITGWGTEETHRVLDTLVRQRKVRTYLAWSTRFFQLHDAQQAHYMKSATPRRASAFRLPALTLVRKRA